MDLDRLFHPRSIAVVGASPNPGSGKLPFYQLLKRAGYAGELYPVNPAHLDIEGVKVRASLQELPDGLDLAIVSVPARLTLSTLRDAVRKKVKFVHFFTSGFSETGDADLERALVEAARGSGTRIVGPNCIGVLSVASGQSFSVSFNPRVGEIEPGNVAFLGQSGGVSLDFVSLAASRKVRLNKAVSYGNQIDLQVGDFLGYFARDPEIAAVAAYVEDVKDGRAFLEALAEATSRKPVVFLKGGATEQGARAAASHTGAMAGSYDVFASAVRQRGGIEVHTLEQLVDVVMLATSDRLPRGPRLGFICAGGGTSVLFTDLAQRNGLSLTELGEKTQKLIRRAIPDVNTSATNPVDLGAFGLDFRVLADTVRAVSADGNVDLVVPYIPLEFVARFLSQQADAGMDALLDAAGELEKPVLPVVASFTDDDLGMEEVRIRFFSRFREAGLPVFGTMQDAVGAVRILLRWHERRSRQGLPFPAKMAASRDLRGELAP